MMVGRITFLHTRNKCPGPNVVSEKIFYVLPIVSLWELITPGVGPFLTPGA